MPSLNSRKHYLDAAKGCGITMIVYGHITGLTNPVDHFFSLFKIVIFFVISGFLVFETGALEKYSTKEYGRRHFRSLILPYILYSVFLIVFQGLLDLYSGRTPAKALERVLGMGYKFVTLRGYSTLWFLPCLFLAQLLFFLVWKRGKTGLKLVCLAVSLGGCLGLEKVLDILKRQLGETGFKFASYPLIAAGKILLAVCFLAAGYYVAVLHRREFRRSVLAAAGVGLLLLTVLLSTCTKHVDLNNLSLGEPAVFFLIGGLTGSIGTILLLESMESLLFIREGQTPGTGITWIGDYLLWAGVNSLVIMATHGTLRFKNLLNQGWISLFGLAQKPGLRYYLETFAILACLMLIEAGVVAIINRYFPVLAGKGFRKRDNFIR